MRLQILSDLHLSGGAPTIPATDADLIVLAGYMRILTAAAIISD